MMVPVRSLLGLGGVPSDRTSASNWLKRQGVQLVKIEDDGRKPEAVNLSDLPDAVRRAFLEREAERMGLEVGTWDEAAHTALLRAPASLRREAERKAEVVRFMAARRAAGMSRKDIRSAVHAAFGTEGLSVPTLDRWEAMVRGLDPINYAPALLDRYKGAQPSAEISPEAWRLFEGAMKAAFKTHRIMALYHDVKAVSAQNGWAWPSYATVMRRFRSLPLAEQIALREGREEAARRMYQHQRRDFGGLRALEWVVLDGRTVDVWVLWPDGSVLRPTALGLVDQVSGKPLGIEFAKAETSEATAILERRVFAEHGAPDNLLTDNGAAFSGHLHAGQVGHKHRNKGNRRRDLEPPGIHIHLGFKLHFALPKNAQAKLMERKFADMSREIDTCPEFAGAHAGSHPGEKPEGRIVPVPFDRFQAVYLARLAAYSARGGRRSQGCKATGTDSYDAAFAALSQGRIKRPLSEAQLYLATMEWTLSTVQRDGTVRGKDGWEYGNDLEDGSQDRLLRFESRKVWVGTNPLDRSQPALVWNPETDRIIANGVQPVRRGKFTDAEGARASARAKAHDRKKTKRIADIDEKAAIAALAAIFAGDKTPEAKAPERVVQPHFGGTIRPARDEAPEWSVTPTEMAAFQRQKDETLRRMKASGEKLA